MRILSLRPEPPGSGESSVVARFDAEISPDVRMFNLVLRRRSDGRLSAGAANLRGVHSATFSPALAAALSAAATSFLGGPIAHERHNAA